LFCVKATKYVLCGAKKKKKALEVVKMNISLDMNEAHKLCTTYLSMCTEGLFSSVVSLHTQKNIFRFECLSFNHVFIGINVEKEHHFLGLQFEPILSIFFYH
jgi:hypothetical protein